MVQPVNPQLPQVPDNRWKDLQFRFDGRWIPDVDPSLIGPNNYAKLENLRYKDSGLEGVNGYSKLNSTALDGSDVTLGNYPKIRNGGQLRSLNTQKTYVLAHSLNSSDQGRVFVNRSDIGSTGDFDNTSNFWKDYDNRVGGGANVQYPYYQDPAVSLEGRFSSAPQGTMAYANSKETMIFGGDESQLAAAFLVEDADGTNPIDVTDIVNNSLQTTGNVATIDSADLDYMIIMTTRPIQGLKAYISSANVSASTTTVQYWTGSTWSADYVDTDNTVSGGASLAQTGTITLTNHTDELVQLMHFEELFLYGYLINLSAGSAGIYRLTVDTACQPIKDVWDGVYRQAIQFQKLNGTSYSDYTLHVNEPSTTTVPVGGDVSGMTTSEHFLIMFTEQMAGIRLTMLGGLINTATNTMKVSYWDGDSYVELTSGSHNYVDGTSSGGSTLAQTGLLRWSPPSDEQARTLFSSYGYVYKFEVVTANISGAKEDESVIIDLVSGVPQQKTVQPFDFTTEYKSRLMLCSFSAGNQANRIDYSVTNAPDVFNGSDSSDDGTHSLLFGGEEKITAAKSLYNRFGSNILSMLLVLKDTETYLLVGDTPDDFVIYPVSKSIGCPAPLSLATGEVNLTGKSTDGTTRNVAMWLSAAGPIMFDGAAISSIRGLENFFDPNNDEYIEWDSVSRARGWMDNVYKEYNILIPSSTGQTENNKWLAYDLLRRKWYEKRTGTANTPQASWEVVAENGERFNYAGIDTGYMLYLENGTSWAGTGITQRLKTGDFFPSSNIWDETTIRKFKLFTHKFEDVSSSNTLNIYYYNNTEETIGSGISWVSSTDGLTGVNVDWTDVTAAMTVSGNAGVTWAATSAVSINVNQDIGAQRILRIITDESRKGWAHAWEFVITTTSVERGFRPIAWGVQYRVEKKDDKATQ